MLLLDRWQLVMTNIYSYILLCAGDDNQSKLINLMWTNSNQAEDLKVVSRKVTQDFSGGSGDQVISFNYLTQFNIWLDIHHTSNPPPLAAKIDENCPTPAALKTKGYTHYIWSSLRATDHYTNLKIIISFHNPFNFPASNADSKCNNLSIIHCNWANLHYLPAEGKKYKQAQALKYHLLPWKKVFLISVKYYYWLILQLASSQQGS